MSDFAPNSPCRTTMNPPGSGASFRPGRDCPNCGKELVKKACGCGHKERR